MPADAKPMRSQGKRNIYCQFYDVCLDFAVKKSWRHMSCELCPYKWNRSGVSDFEYTIDGDVPYYRLSDNPSKKVLYVD